MFRLRRDAHAQLRANADGGARFHPTVDILAVSERARLRSDGNGSDTHAKLRADADWTRCHPAVDVLDVASRSAHLRCDAGANRPDRLHIDVSVLRWRVLRRAHRLVTALVEMLLRRRTAVVVQKPQAWTGAGAAHWAKSACLKQYAAVGDVKYTVADNAWFALIAAVVHNRRRIAIRGLNAQTLSGAHWWPVGKRALRGAVCLL